MITLATVGQACPVVQIYEIFPAPFAGIPGGSVTEISANRAEHFPSNCEANFYRVHAESQDLGRKTRPAQPA